jgi:hypothetical protein
VTVVVALGGAGWHIGQIAVALSDPTRSESFGDRLTQVQKTLAHVCKGDIERLLRRRTFLCGWLQL